MKNLTPIPLDLPGKIYRSPMPFAIFDHNSTTLDEYRKAEIDIVVMLIEPGEDVKYTKIDLEKLYHENKFDVIRFPIADFDTPDDLDNLAIVLKNVVDRASKGENVAIHCFAGRGRTGLFIALLARMVMGYDGRKAIDWLRQYFPAIETTDQEKIVIDFFPDG